MKHCILRVVMGTMQRLKFVVSKNERKNEWIESFEKAKVKLDRFAFQQS